jgi:hypothetical protein
MVANGTLVANTSPVTLNVTGLRSNTKYDTYWVAVDIYGNAQGTLLYRQPPMQTNDDIPPVTMNATVITIGGTNASIVLQYDEAAIPFYTIQSDSTDCPPAGQVSGYKHICTLYLL